MRKTGQGSQGRTGGQAGGLVETEDSSPKWGVPAAATRDPARRTTPGSRRTWGRAFCPGALPTAQ